MRHVLGLHTKQERQKAYGMAKKRYEYAMKNKSENNIAYALGYIDAIIELAKDEYPDDKDFITYLEELAMELGEHVKQA